MIFRRVAPQPDGSRKRLSQPFLVSVGVHLVVAVALMRMLIVNMGLSPIQKRQTVREQHVGFVRISGGVKVPLPGRSGGDGKPLTPREIHVVAPVSIPTTIPAPSGPVTKPTEEGTGLLVGTGGPTRGVRPQYSDPRVWEPPGPVVSAPKSVKQTIDSLIADAIAPYKRLGRSGGAATRSDGLDHRERRLQVGNRQARHTTRPRFDSHGATRHASPQSSGKSVDHGA